jgi:acetyl-CoA carboxylase biotin carboxylase subunit
MAIERMLRALSEYHVGGIATNVNLFRRILHDEGFRTANIDTGYLERLLDSTPSQVKGESPRLDSETEKAAAIAAGFFERMDAQAPIGSEAAPTPSSAWKAAARREALRS